MFVSIVIPNFCHSEYLDQRIQSVLNQTFQNFEVIILDDCSSDGGRSHEIIEKYRNHPKVTKIVYNETNGGSAFKQWQKGIKLAQGDLIWIAESDDFCEPTLLDALVFEFDKDPECVLAFVDSLHVDTSGIPLEHKKQDCIVEHLSGLVFIQKYLCIGNTVENASSALFRRDVALNVDTQYVNYKGAGDQLFWIEIAEQGNVAFNHAMLNCFRQHRSNTTKRLYADGTTFRELLSIYRYICEKGYIPSVRQRLKVKHYFIHWIYDDVKDSKVRTALINCWDPFYVMRVYDILVGIRDLMFGSKQ